MQQSAMNNAEKQGEKWAGKAHSVIDKGISEIKSIKDTDIKAVASDVGQRVRSVSNDAFEESVEFVKRHPVGSAIGLTAVGFFAGMLSSRARK